MIYLEFQGWPSTPDNDGSISVIEGGQYSGIPEQTQNWRPGEVRCLVDSEGFNAGAVSAKLLNDFGKTSDAFKHLRSRQRPHFGFKKTTKKQWEKQQND